LQVTRKEARARWVSLVIGLGACLFAPNASAAVLYDQSAGSADGGCISSSDFGVANKVAQGADDFPVPASTTWQIGSVDVIGSGSLTGSPTAAVFLYSAGALPGAQIFSQTGIPITGFNNLSIPVTGAPQLTTGTYWISVQITDPVQWSWCAKQAQFGAVAAWRNPGNGFSTGCTSYAQLTACEPPGKSFLFRLNAVEPVAPPATAATTTKKKKCKNKKYRRHHKKKCRKRKRR
jgi:hypothetical protein